MHGPDSDGGDDDDAKQHTTPPRSGSTISSAIGAMLGARSSVNGTLSPSRQPLRLPHYIRHAASVSRQGSCPVACPCPVIVDMIAPYVGMLLPVLFRANLVRHDIAAGDLEAKREGGSMKLAAGAVVNCLPVLLERNSSASQDSRTAGQTRMVARTVALVVKVL